MKANNENYEKLYNKVKDFNNRYKHQLTICPAIKGELYDECEKKIMFVNGFNFSHGSCISGV